MHIVLAILFFVHGIAHVVGFLVYWKLIKSKEITYKTTLLNGRADVGNSGIRVFGALWLLADSAFTIAAVGVLLKAFWWIPLAHAAAIYSLLLCILGWPDSKIGVVVNIAILAYLLLAGNVTWLPVVAG
jgi:hypothetical protein